MLVFATHEARRPSGPQHQRGGRGSASIKERFDCFHIARLYSPRIDERLARQEVQNHRINKSRDLLVTSDPITEERDDRDSCFRTSTTSGSLHAMRGSRPPRTSGKIDRHAETMPASPPMAFSMSQSPQNINSWCCWWSASRWKSRSDESTP